MTRSHLPATSRDTEILLGALRLGLLPLLLAGSLIPGLGSETPWFAATLAAFTVYAVALLALAAADRVGLRLALTATAIDIVAVAALSFQSGGAFSEARRAFYAIPILVAFRLVPWLTAAAGAAGVLAYTIQAVNHATTRPHANASIAMFDVYLLWIAVAAALLSTLLRRRSERVGELADARLQLLVDVQDAEERERRSLAEGLHDFPVQNLLAARQDLEEAADAAPSPALDRAHRAITETIGSLRNAIFELHPYLLDEVGLPAALRAAAERAAAAGGFHVDVDADPLPRLEHDRLLYSLARELLGNAAKHAEAENVRLELVRLNGDIMLRVRDDGRGFSPDHLSQRLREGHIGLASHRERVERAGGRLTIDTAAERGTTVEVRLPG